MSDRPLRLYIIAGEASGDELGGAVLDVLAHRLDGGLEIAGIGGDAMTKAGLRSLFPMEELSLIGVTAIARRLPGLLGRLRQTTDDVLRFKPDLLLVIDSPEFTHRIAQRVRRQLPDLPIVKWVSPTVWAWRPGRAAEMRAYVDHLLAVLPFEPDVHLRLGGPPCTYVGHPLLSRLDRLTPGPGERPEPGEGVPTKLLLLPGSRKAEVNRLLPIFGRALPVLAEILPAIDPVIVAAPRRRQAVERMIHNWPIKPRLVSGGDEKDAAFRSAHVALAASGTVTLELALAGVPTIAAYRVDPLEWVIARIFLHTWTILLPNFVLGRQAVREYIGDVVRPEPLAYAVKTLADDTPERRAQLASFDELRAIMSIDRAPAERAAEIILDLVGSH